LDVHAVEGELLRGVPRQARLDAPGPLTHVFGQRSAGSVTLLHPLPRWGPRSPSGTRWQASVRAAGCADYSG